MKKIIYDVGQKKRSNHYPTSYMKDVTNLIHYLCPSVYVLGLISILLLVVACGNAPANKAVENAVVPVETETTPSAIGTTTHVVIENFKFMPVDLELKVGDTVDWTNKDSAEHTVTFENEEFSEKLPIGGKATFTFEKKGEYKYYCAFHPSMQGKILVS